MHPEAFEFVRRFADGKTFGSVVEIGSRDINGSVKPLFDTPDYWGVDLYPGVGVDEVADATDWVAEPPADCIVCCEVLEHAPDIGAILRNIARSLNPGGCFVMTCATHPRAPHSSHDGGHVRPTEHYANVDPAEFQQTVEGLGIFIELMEVHPDRGDLYAVARLKS